jgi:hypothetical protein
VGTVDIEIVMKVAEGGDGARSKLYDFPVK